MGSTSERIGTQRLRPGAAWNALMSEHDTLVTAAARLERRLGHAVSADGALAEVRRELLAFRSRLLAHLEAEERGGVLERAAAAAPRLARRVDKLRREHEALREGVHALVAEAAGPGGCELHARFADFRRRLLGHERAENDVLHAAYRDDLGGSG